MPKMGQAGLLCGMPKMKATPKSSNSFASTEPRNNHPKNGPIFTRRRLQPIYNPKTRYLQILRKYRSHKCHNCSALQKSRNLSTDSMYVPGSSYWHTACASRKSLRVEGWFRKDKIRYLIVKNSSETVTHRQQWHRSQMNRSTSPQAAARARRF